MVKNHLRHEPSAIWSTRLVVFDKEISLTQNVIMSQGAAALSAMVARIDRLCELLSFIPNLIAMYPHPEIPQALTEICMHQGIACSILFNDSVRANGESASKYAGRIARAKYVGDYTQGANLQILKSRAIRNRLVHIDEYLTSALDQKDCGWFIDVAIHTRDQFTSNDGIEVRFCRSLIVSEWMILHLGTEIHLPSLRNEAAMVLATVFGVEVPAPPPALDSYPQSPPSEPPRTEA